MSQFGFRKETGEWFVGMGAKDGKFYITNNPFNKNIVKLNLVQCQKQYYVDFPKKTQVNEWFKNFQIADMKQLELDQTNYTIRVIEQAKAQTEMNLKQQLDLAQEADDDTRVAEEEKASIT